MEQNYTLGSGQLFFARRDPVTKLLGGEYYIGNSPSFNVTVEQTKLDHRSSDRKGREKDRSAVLETNRTGAFDTDSIRPKNIAMFLLGDEEALTIVGATVAAEQVGITGVGVEKGMFYQLGQTALNPTGARNVTFPGASATAFTLKKGSVSLISGVDFLVNGPLGRVEILPTSTVVQEGDLLTAGYTTTSSTRSRIVSSGNAIEGALRYIADNTDGENYDFYMPSVNLSPNGDFELKAEEWQVLPFTVEILKPNDMEAIYCDGRPYILTA